LLNNLITTAKFCKLIELLIVKCVAVKITISITVSENGNSATMIILVDALAISRTNRCVPDCKMFWLMCVWHKLLAAIVNRSTRKLTLPVLWFLVKFVSISLMNTWLQNIRLAWRHVWQWLSVFTSTNDSWRRLRNQSCLCICLSVGRITTKATSRLHWSWCYDWAYQWEELINFWWWSGHGYGFQITFTLPSPLRNRAS